MPDGAGGGVTEIFGADVAAAGFLAPLGATALGALPLALAAAAAAACCARAAAAASRSAWARSPASCCSSAARSAPELVDDRSLRGAAGLELLALLREVDRRGFVVVDRLLALRVGAIEQLGPAHRVERVGAVEHGTEVGTGTLVDLERPGPSDDRGPVGVVLGDTDLLLELGDLRIEIFRVLLTLEPLLRDLVDLGARLRDLVGGALRVRSEWHGNERDDHRDHEDACSRQHGVLAGLRYTGTAPEADSAYTGAAHC